MKSLTIFTIVLILTTLTLDSIHNSCTFFPHPPFIGLLLLILNFVPSQLMEAFHDIQRLRIEAGPGFALPILM